MAHISTHTRTTPTPVLCNKCRRNPAPDHCTKIARGERLTKRTSRRTAAQRFIKPWTIYARASRPGCRAAVLLACACTHADADACGMLCVNATATPPRITFPANWRFITTRAGQARRSKISILHLGIRAGVLRALPTLEQVILMACMHVHADADACALLCANATAVPRITQKDRAKINYLLSKIYYLLEHHEDCGRYHCMNLGTPALAPSHPPADNGMDTHTPTPMPVRSTFCSFYVFI